MGAKMKTCSKCGEEKDYSEFIKESRNKDGLSGTCEECDKLRRQEYYQNNKEHMKGRMKEWRQKNPERQRENSRKWRSNNREEYNRKRREWYANNKELHDQRVKRWADNNPEKVREKSRRWYENNFEQASENRKLWYQENKDYMREWQRERYRNNPKVRLSYSIRSCLRNVLSKIGKEKSGSTNYILGYSDQELEKRIEHQFTDGMCWENYGEWEVDHTIPINHFLNKGETRPHIINALCNLQPLWMSDNRSKKDKLLHKQDETGEDE